MPHRSSNPAGTIAVTAGRFKDQSLEFVRRVARTGEEVIITVRGEPKAKLVPAVRRVGNRFVGSGQQTVRIAGGAAALAALTGAGAPELAAPANPLALPSPGSGSSDTEHGPRRLVGLNTGNPEARQGTGEDAGTHRRLGDGDVHVPHAKSLSAPDPLLDDDDDAFLLADDEELLLDGVPDGDS